MTDEELEEMPEKISDHFDRLQELLEAELNSDADSGEYRFSGCSKRVVGNIRLENC